jgi:AcrR family transcriptional regulator
MADAAYSAAVADTPTIPEVPAVRGRGRPRAADRTDAILAAAGDLFDEVGYDQLRVQDIATRAGVGLATLYRRWPTKQALLADALREKDRSFGGAGEGEPLEVVGQIASHIARGTLGPRGEFLPGLLAAIRDDEDLAEALRIGVIDPLHARIRAELAIVLGPDHPQLELLVEMVPAVCVYRALAPVDPGDPDELVTSMVQLLSTVAGAHPSA